MSDEREFKIKITGDASSLNAASQQSAQGLQEVGTAAKTGAEGLKENAKAADKSFVSHGQLKSAVKGLKEEFPALAHIAKLALNPIAFTVAGIAGAFALWHARIESLTRLLGGLELPDFKDDGVGKISATAEAWEKYADAMRKVKEELGGANENRRKAETWIADEERRVSAITKAKHEYEMAKLEQQRPKIGEAAYQSKRARLESAAKSSELGIKEQAEWDKFAVHLFEVLDARAAAEAKRKEAGKINVEGKDREDAILANRKEAAEKAKVNRAQRGGELAALEDFNGPDAKPKDILWVIWTAIKNMQSRQSLIDMTRADMARDQFTIKQYDRSLAAVPGNEKARRRRDELLAGAAGSEGEAAKTEAGIPDEERRITADAAAEKLSAAYTTLATLYKGIEELTKNHEQLAERIGTSVDANKAILPTIAEQFESQTAAIKESQARISQLEGALINTRSR